MLTFYWLLILNGFVPWICRTCHFQFQQYFIIAIKTCGLGESHHVPTLNWLFKPTLHPQSTVNICQWGKTSFRTNILSPPQPPTAACLLNLPLLVSDTSLGLHFQLPLFVLISWSGFLGQAFTFDVPSGFSLECQVLCWLLGSQAQSPTPVTGRGQDSRTHFISLCARPWFPYVIKLDLFWNFKCKGEPRTYQGSKSWLTLIEENIMTNSLQIWLGKLVLPLGLICSVYAPLLPIQQAVIMWVPINWAESWTQYLTVQRCQN